MLSKHLPVCIYTKWNFGNSWTFFNAPRHREFYIFNALPWRGQKWWSSIRLSGKNDNTLIRFCQGTITEIPSHHTLSRGRVSAARCGRQQRGTIFHRDAFKHHVIVLQAWPTIFCLVRFSSQRKQLSGTRFDDKIYDYKLIIRMMLSLRMVLSYKFTPCCKSTLLTIYWCDDK